MARDRHGFHHFGQPWILLPDCAGGDFAFLRGGAGGDADFVTDENAFERHARLCALVAGDFRVQRGDDFVRSFDLVREVGGVQGDFIGDQNLRLESARLAEIFQQARLHRNFIRLINDRLGLFRRHLEMAALLQLALRGFPPLLPVVLDDIGHERLFDLHLRGPAAVAFEHQLHEAEMVLRREFRESARIVRLAGKDVMLRDRLE